MPQTIEPRVPKAAPQQPPLPCPQAQTVAGDDRVAANPPQPSRRRLLFGVFYLAITAVVVCSAVEVLVRLLHLAPPLTRQYHGYVADPHLPYKPQPLSVLSGRSSSGEFDFEYQHNSFGFRDEEQAPAKPEGVFRILGLGDSFTYGVGASFDETYLHQLQDMLNRRPGAHPRVEIIKGGMPGHFPELERLLLEHYGRQFEPNLMLVAFLPNDVIDTFYGADTLRVSKLGYLTTREAAELGEAGAWLYVHSHAARMILGKMVASRLQKGRRDRWPEVYKPDGYHEDDWRQLELQYEKMIQIARSIGARIFLVHIPQKGPWEESTSYPPSRLAQWCAERGVAFVDTLPALRAASGEATLYWDKDGHCNAAGYRVIAATLYDALIERNLVP